jgi:hypothetical protein
MVPHLNPYLKFDIYGNVSGPSHYVGHFVGNMALNNRCPLQPMHSGPGPEFHQHPAGFPYDFGQRPKPQYYYPSSSPTPPNSTLLSESPQNFQHLSVSPLIPGSSSTHYLGNDQQVRHGLSRFLQTDPKYS